jgi:pimeloyl-ACP methyl ester carboxylesterase
MFSLTLPRFRRLAMLFVPFIALAVFLVHNATRSAANTQGSAVQRPTIVLVHGDWADASSWNSVMRRLHNRGFTVVAPPNTLRGPIEDSAYLASYLHTLHGPIVLVAHSYGGFVTTNAATGNPNVRALVYIDSFLPAKGETGGAILAGSGTCVDQSALNPVPFNGGVDLYLRWAPNPPYPGYRVCFANGVPMSKAALLFAGQRPAAAAQFAEPNGEPAWKRIPSWSLIGTLDHVIPPALQKAMSTRAGAHISYVRAGHLSLITRPGVVTRTILAAVHATI